MSEEKICQLMMACRNGSLDLIRFLIENEKIPINSQSEDGFTPLCCAILKRHFHVCEYLVKQGATLDLYSNRVSPLDLRLDSIENEEIIQSCVQAYINFVKEKKNLRIQHKSNNHRKILEVVEGSTSKMTPTNETCSICFEEKSLNCFTQCGHKFCTDCISTWYCTKIRSNSSFIKCLHNSCDKFISPTEVDLVLRVSAPILLKRWQEKFLDMYLESCINFCKCNICKAGWFLEESCNESISCPNCSHSYCSQCEGPYHPNKSCIEFWSERAIKRDWIKERVKESKIEESTKSLVLKTTRYCPGCLSRVEKNGGCNHMTCRLCCTQYCWNCGKMYEKVNSSWRHPSACNPTSWWENFFG